MRSFRSWLRQNPHIWLMAYWLFYLVGFFTLEQLTPEYTVIHCALDDLIPFNELFIIPYCLWYLWMPGTLLYLFFKDKQDYLRLCFIMFVGMTLALLCYVIWPTGLDLRQPLPRDNVLCQLVALLRSIDTPTNVCPSIHISSTTAIAIVGLRSRLFKNDLPVKALIWCMTILITLSTLFLQQHSVIDVAAGAVLSALLTPIAYRIPWQKVFPDKAPAEAKA